MAMGVHQDRPSPSPQARELDQGTVIPDDATRQPVIDQTALNKLRAQMMKAKLRKAPDAAKLEAERRAAHEKEAAQAKEREKANPIVLPGLPTSSTWGSGSPAPTASSPWSKPSAVKAGVVATPVTPTSGDRKKTLAEIQRAL